MTAEHLIAGLRAALDALEGMEGREGYDGDGIRSLVIDHESITLHADATVRAWLSESGHDAAPLTLYGECSGRSRRDRAVYAGYMVPIEVTP